MTAEVNFVEVNTQQIMSELIADFEEYTGETLANGDQRRQFLQGFGYVFSGILNNINTTGRSELLRYAHDAGLDALGELLGVARLDADYAHVTIKFNLSNAQSANITIPQGTRVTPDGKLMFATDKALVIASGAENGTVTATATEAGTLYNGFVAGQIDKLVDGNAYVESVENTTESIDGTDIESDDAYRARIQKAPFSYSTAGAEEAYKYLALSADANVGDVQVWKSAAGTVKIAVVKNDGSIPETTDDVLTAIDAACSAKTKRPLTDNVVVVPATAVDTSINVSYYISTDDLTNLDSIKTAVEKAVADYKAWQTASVGRDIIPDRLLKMMYNAGASKVVLTAPVETTVGTGEVANFTATSVVYAGTSE